MIKKSLIVLGLAISAIGAQSAKADLLANWNFNNTTIGQNGALGEFITSGTSEIYNASNKTLTVASFGEKASTATINFSGLSGSMGGTANNNWGSFAGDASNAYGGAATGGSLSVLGNGNNGSTVVFTLSTTGYENLVLSYGTRGTSTGFTTQTWSYSINGTDYTDFSAVTGRNVTSWSTQSVDFSSVAALDNQNTVYIRLTYSGASATSTNGNNRIDNVQFNASQAAPVPEPAAVGILAIAGAGILLRRKKA